MTRAVLSAMRKQRRLLEPRTSHVRNPDECMAMRLAVHDMQERVITDLQAACQRRAAGAVGRRGAALRDARLLLPD